MKKIIASVFILAIVFACKQKPKETIEEAVVKNEVANELEWISLFDGKTFNGWHIYNNGEVTNPWSIEDGAMVFNGRKGNPEYNIVTDKEYTNFKLSIEWKISEAGNSGILWGVIEDKKYSYPYNTGAEIQVLDNEKHPDAKVNGKLHQACSLYDMIAPSQDVTKPVGEWNLCEIYINHKTNEGKAWLNGVLMVEFPVEGEKWETMIANSKFKGWEGFGKYQTGKICLQDHENKVSYRNIKIKEL
jgi:translation elongation factor P/translation initiation factor 5A